MKQIILDNESTTYFIDEEGRVLNKKTNNWLKGSINGGYRIYNLRHKNKRYEKVAHRLVAEYFIPNPDNLPVVNHIDGNKLNNSVNNLEWATVSENNFHAYDTGLKERNNGVLQRIKYSEDLDSEVWRPYKDTVYMISNKGRARSTKTNNLMKGKVNSEGYVEWCFFIDGKKQTRLAHRVVYDVFGLGLLDEDKVINHKDGIKTNNQIENLEQVTDSDNSNHAYQTGLNLKFKKVGKYTLQGELLEIYPSCAEAARQNEGCYPNLIVNVCNGKKKTHHGYIWKYE